MRLELNNAEAEMLTEMMTAKKHELPVAIHHCRSRDFKVLLKDREKIVDGLLVRMGVN